MQLTAETIIDLRKTLDQSFGIDFNKKLSDSEANEIGVLLLTILAEGLKLKIHNPEHKVIVNQLTQGTSCKTSSESKN